MIMAEIQIKNSSRNKIRSDFLVYYVLKKKIECSDQRAEVVVELVGVPQEETKLFRHS